MKKFSALVVFLVCLASFSYAAILLMVDTKPKPEVVKKQIATSAIDPKIGKQIDQFIQEIFEDDIENGMDHGLKIRTFKNMDTDQTIMVTVKWETFNGEVRFTIDHKQQ